MKSFFFLLLSLLTMVTAVNAQEFDSVIVRNGGSITVRNPGTYPWGINLDLSFPGGWAREFSLAYKGKGKLFSFGAKGTDGDLDYGYIGGNTTDPSAYQSPWMTFKGNGFVGINTLTPSARLEISGGPLWTTNGWRKSLKIQHDAAVEFTGLDKSFGLGTSGNMFYFFHTKQDGTGPADYYMVANGNTGNVTIGGGLDTQEAVTPYKLAVNGAIGARRIRVQQGPWADHVFYDDYDLPKLSDIEKYIKKNKHLEGIPSQEEVHKDGIDLGEMNKLLLQKIEELTLHIIDLNKKVEVLQQAQKKNKLYNSKRTGDG